MLKFSAKCTILCRESAPGTVEDLTGEGGGEGWMRGKEQGRNEKRPCDMEGKRKRYYKTLPT